MPQQPGQDRGHRRLLADVTRDCRKAEGGHPTAGTGRIDFPFCKYFILFTLIEKTEKSALYKLANSWYVFIVYSSTRVSYNALNLLQAYFNYSIGKHIGKFYHRS